MSKLSEFGVPGAITGILHPSLTYRFRVLFEAEGVDTRILTTQVVSVSDFGFFPKSADSLEIKFEIDCQYNVVKLLQQLSNYQLVLKIEVLDGDENVVHNFIFNGSKLEHLHHSQFDYRGGDTNRTRGKIKFKDYAALEDELSMAEIAKMKLLFDSISFEFENNSRPLIEHTTSVTAVFSYTNVE